VEVKREHKIDVLYFVGAFVAIFLIQNLVLQSAHLKTITYSEFQQLVEQGKVDHLVVGPDQITGMFKESESAPQPSSGQAVSAGAQQHFTTQRVPPELLTRLLKGT
jgi:cell division protease FtsH